MFGMLSRTKWCI